MPVNDTTTNRSYQKPNIANTLADDVGRLRSALDAIDTDMASKAPTAGPTFTGVTTIAAGSAAAPSLTFTGATSDTGLYSPGTDQVSLCTGGVEKLRFDSFDGNPLIEITYPTVLPSLDLNFAATKRLDPRVTFSRSSSGTYYDAAGVLQSAATDVARFDHNPSTGESLGLLVEEARTNLWNYSANPTFVAVGGSVTPYSELAPDGTYTASTFVPSAASDSTDRYLVVPRSNTLSTQQTVTLYVKTTYFYLVFFSNGEGTQNNVTVNVGINLLTNSVYQTTSVNGTYTSSSITNVANGYKRISITYQTGGGVGGKQPGIIVSDTQFTIIGNPGRASDQTANYTTDGIKSLTIWGVQLETGSFPTSYIPTPATFTGRTSTATYYDANGVIQTALSGVARSNAYFPDSNGVMRSAGLLLEGAATNLLNGSQTLATSGGTQNNWVDTNITRDGTLRTSPDSTANALRVTAAAANATLISSAAIGTSAQRTFSIFLRRVTGTGNIDYTLNNGATWTTQAITTSWKRYSFPATTADQQVGIRIATSGDAIELWGAQLETGSYPTSYIPTTTSTVTRSADTSTSATVTRSADVAQMTGANFSSWWNTSSGTFQSSFRSVLSGTRPVLSVDDNTVNNRIELYTSTANQKFTVTAGGVTQADLTAGSASSASVNKQAAVYSANDFSTSLAGATAVTDTSGTVPVVTQMRIGANQAGNTRTSPIASITYYPVRLPDATLQAITK